MKNILLLVIIMTAGHLAYSQAKPATRPKAVAKPIAKVAASVAAMKNTVDSVSYSLGMMIAQFYKQQGVSKVNTALVSRAINDALKGGKTLLNEEQSTQCINNYITDMREEKAAGAKKAGQEFLAANKTKPGVVTLPSGLQYQILTEGKGPKPSITDTVRCHYHGMLIDGTVFDSSVDRGQPAEFPVGAVIRGWVEALPLMPIGSKWKLFIPSELGYGDSGAGPKIGPGATLIFDVELLGIVGK